MDHSLCRTCLRDFVSAWERAVGLEFGAFGLMVLEFGFKALGFWILWVWCLRLTSGLGCRLQA